MQNDPFTAIVDPILKLLNQALPTDLASSVGSQIEATAQRACKQMALVPKHEFEAQHALLVTLEAQVAHLEGRLHALENTSPTHAAGSKGPSPADHPTEPS